MENTNEITLNGKVYVLKEDREEVEKDALRFDFKTEMKLYKALAKIFSTTPINKISEKAAVEREFMCVTDPANVCMVEAKTERAKRILCRFFDKEDHDKEKIPDWEKEGIETDGQFCSYSHEYLRKFFEVLDITSDASRIWLKTNHPMTAENQHFKFVLAPRINDDDEEKVFGRKEDD